MLRTRPSATRMSAYSAPALLAASTPACASACKVAGSTTCGNNDDTGCFDRNDSAWAGRVSPRPNPATVMDDADRNVRRANGIFKSDYCVNIALDSAVRYFTL